MGVKDGPLLQELMNPRFVERGIGPEVPASYRPLIAGEDGSSTCRQLSTLSTFRERAWPLSVSERFENKTRGSTRDQSICQHRRRY